MFSRKLLRPAIIVSGVTFLLLITLLVQPQSQVATAQSATLIVDDNCSLADAITAANENTEVSGCQAGTTGRDVIVLRDDVTLATVDNTGPNGPNGLPVIISSMLILGNRFTIARDSAAPPFRLFEIAPGGDLHLEGVTLRNGLVVGGNGRNGTNASADGADGEDGDFTFVFVVYTGSGDPGGDADPGNPGGNGISGGNAQGGAIFNRGSLYLLETTLSSHRVTGGRGGVGGDGSNGGTGGEGGGLGKVAPIIIPEIGGTGGRGGDGGPGGVGGRGGAARGAAIYNDGGDVRVAASTLTDNAAQGGNGGRGGNGGAAGFGGDGGTDGTDIASGGPGGLGGAGGTGGTGGVAQGAAIFNANGTVNVWLSTIEGNRVQSGDGADGGEGNAGGDGGTQTGDGGLGGSGGIGGDGGLAQGGAVYNSGGSLILDRTTLSNHTAISGIGGDGSRAGEGGDGGDPFFSIAGDPESFEALSGEVILSLFGQYGPGYRGGGPGGFGGSGGDGGAAQGGAVYNASGDLEIRYSTLHTNLTQSGAGGVGGSGNFNGTSTLLETLEEEFGVEGDLSGNGLPGDVGISAGGGVALDDGFLTVDSATLSANQSVSGGGLWQAGGALTVISSTITRNQASTGGGLAVTIGDDDLPPEIINSIVTENIGTTPDVDGPIQSQGNNLVGVVLDLGSLEDNGGPTPTIAIPAGSLAVNQGRCLSIIDQRGVPRNDGLCDIGAYERGGSGTVSPGQSASGDDDDRSGSVQLTLPANSFGRVIAANGHFQQSPAEIGVQAVLERGVIAAVDVYTQDGTSGGGEVCLAGTGSLIFLPAAAVPRTPSWLPSTQRAGVTCGVLPGDGTLVLVEQGP